MRLLFLIFLLTLPVLGCGPAGHDPGKYKDMDRPKAAEPAK
ncbi:MAG TPA: hypothetical protein VGJ05_20250 [Fimbriiglobus sp.]